MNLGGSLTRQAEADNPVNEGSPHIVNIGRMVEVSFIWKKVVERGRNSSIWAVDQTGCRVRDD